MERKIFSQILLLSSFFLILISGCIDKSDNNDKPKDIWDIDKDGIPKFVETNYIELVTIYRISRFRSSVGHDYS